MTVETPLIDVREFRSDEVLSAADLNHVADVVRSLYQRKAVHVFKTSASEIGKGVWEPLEYAHTRLDKARLHDHEGDPSRIILKGAGAWLAGLNVALANTSTQSGAIFGRIRKNGNRTIAHAGRLSEYDASVRLNAYGGTIASDQDDWLDSLVWQNNVESTDVIRDDYYSPSFWAIRLARYGLPPGTWTTPTTWANGNVPTPAQLDAIREQVRYLAGPPHCLLGEETQIPR